MLFSHVHKIFVKRYFLTVHDSIIIKNYLEETVNFLQPNVISASDSAQIQTLLKTYQVPSLYSISDHIRISTNQAKIS